MRQAIAIFVFLLVAPSVDRSIASAQPVPTPLERLGFEPGADGKLADWATVVDYFRAVDAASDRVSVVEAGKTTEGRPYLTAVISAPETIGRLDVYRYHQRRLHDPRLLSGPEQERLAVEESKPVVVITCSIHSNEPASTLAAVELLHQLASGDDRDTREILDGVILILVPSANPDGVDKVKTWYELSRGKPWEGNGAPELYHRHAGHDTNRDWFMLNLPETRILTRVLYKEWFPTILYDVHEMVANGPRVFVPPYRAPFNPNVDHRIRQSVGTIGAHMRADLTAAGTRGIISSTLFDDWWNGGARTTPERHNIVSVLTETASVRIASPIFTDAEERRRPSRRRPGSDDLWPGGDWRLRDIVDCELVCSRSLLRLAARYRREFQTNLLTVARTAIARGREEAPGAWIIPAEQHDPGAAATMAGILHDSGVEVHKAVAPFRADGRDYEAGDWIVYASQPYRGHVKDLMERQHYPARLDARGRAESPYDVAGWTLPLMMGVSAVEVAELLTVAADRLDSIVGPSGSIIGEAVPLGGFLTIDGRSNDDYRLLNRLLKSGVAVEIESSPASPSRFRIADDPATRERIGPMLKGLAVRLSAALAPDAARGERLVAPRIGVYQSWVPSTDEGWTRYVLEQYEYAYETMHDADVRGGDLARRIDVLIVPSSPASILRRGYEPGQSDPKYTGGLGPEGAEAIRRFVASGGVLVCLEDACSYAIEELKPPIKNALQGVSSSLFLCPGSVLGATLAGGGRLSMGMAEAFFVYFDRSLAFDVPPNAEEQGVRVAARYASKPLESGWMIGAERIEGKAALVEVAQGTGRVVLFGFPPQHRGWTHGTYRLLFNALVKLRIQARSAS
ncbi:MAG: M14 family metallopeptidase [Paludisphaera borealis]|uniref:M14 family metallopeptidase n=1 Tax=Paludisphaera borealis TaxID=1387353 RepID=UPI00283E934B|nr:M14 family metallopeptidase [Paludisphaera borealis]MDR3617759.1 M14 family metallopeptidase [Paludisphaera borealis]